MELHDEGAQGEIRLDGRVAVVTGAGNGLGRAHALALASRGAKVVVNDAGVTVDGTGASHSPADAVVDEIQAVGGSAVPNYDSVATPDGGRGIVETALEAFGAVDVVVANAGIVRDAPYEEETSENFDLVVGVHLKGSFYVTQAAFKVMKEAGHGRIVFTSSSAGLYGNPHEANYGAAKAGVFGLANVLALEGEPFGVLVNTIAPLAHTRMTSDRLVPALAERLKPELVSPLVVYLGSEQCTFTHMVFSVGGGSYSRIFVATTPGWRAPRDAAVTPEDVRDHFEEISDTSEFTIASSTDEEAAVVLGSRRE